MAEKAIGFIETFGLTAAIAAADAACKSANVKLLGYEYERVQTAAGYLYAYKNGAGEVYQIGGPDVQA